MLTDDELYNKFVNDFSTEIYNLRNDKPFSDYIFLCVGSDKVTGDSFGPIVGDKLRTLFKNFYNNIKVIGTLDNPVYATNLENEVIKIYKDYNNPCIIAIDAALSNNDNIGNIIVSKSKMKFGKGTNKKILEVGDISIKGIVGKDYRSVRYNFSQLQNTSLSIVIKLANVTSEGIYSAIKYR